MSKTYKSSSRNRRILGIIIIITQTTIGIIIITIKWKFKDKIC